MNFYGKMTNSSGKVKEFIWSNGILSIGFLTSTVFKNILSIVFQVQFLGCPGKPKFQFHILCGWRTLNIYIYIHVVMSWDVLSVGVSTAD